jgi:prepilin-type N-terminal cleavage/methylation domain-containing protein
MKMVNQNWLRRRFTHRCNEKNGRDSPAVYAAFTFIEILIVVVILAIAAMMAVPMIGSAETMQIRSAANIIAADLEYAKSMAISRQKKYSVVFDTVHESYRIEDDVGTIINHPVKKGFPYIVNFSSDSRLSRVDISQADFDGTNVIKFDYLGSPYNGHGNPLNAASIVLHAGGSISTITVEPVTGFILISD